MDWWEAAEQETRKARLLLNAPRATELARSAGLLESALERLEFVRHGFAPEYRNGDAIGAIARMRGQAVEIRSLAEQAATFLLEWGQCGRATQGCYTAAGEPALAGPGPRALGEG